MQTRKLYFVLFTILLVFVTSCRKDDITTSSDLSNPLRAYEGKFITNYFTLLCRISKSSAGFFPPQVARAYGYTGIANYEAVVNGIDAGKTLQGQLTGFAPGSIAKPNINLAYNWAISSNAATAAIIKKMFDQDLSAANISAVDSLEALQLKSLSLNASPGTVQRSIDFGKNVAAAVYQYSLNDGGNLSYKDPFQLPFSMPADAFCWVPTSAALHPVSPFWGNNRPFLMQDVANTQPLAHKLFSIDSASSFYQEALNVYRQVKRNTPQQVSIVKFWADDPFNTCTPCGHTFNIMTQLLEESNASLEKASVALAALSISENDAFISCWKAKYTYNLIRPVSYIKKYIDPAFTTVIGTPAFPAYSSGHSCEIGAGSRVFIKFFTNGDGNYSLADRSQLQYGFAIRNYSNFDDMAKECADSRFFGGIHYAMDNEVGLESGKMIGNNIVTQIKWPQNIQ